MDSSGATSLGPGARLKLRPMLPAFGCGIHDLVFAPNDPTTISLAVDQVRRALVAYERRIDVLDVGAETAPEQANVLLIRVDYRAHNAPIRNPTPTASSNVV